MAEILKMPELVDQDGVTKVQIRRCRIKTRLYPKWPASLQFFDEFCLNQQLVGTTLDQFKILFQNTHDYPRHTLPVLDRLRICYTAGIILPCSRQ